MVLFKSLSYFIRSSPKRQLQSVALVSFQILILAIILSTMFLVRTSGFPAFTQKNGLGETGDVSFTISGNLGTLQNTSWGDLKEPDLNSLIKETISYVPIPLWNLIESFKLVWKAEIINQSDPNLGQISLIGLSKSDYFDLTSQLDINESVFAYGFGRVFSNNVSAIVEDPTSPFADIHLLSINQTVSQNENRNLMISKILSTDIARLTVKERVVIFNLPTLLLFLNSFQRLQMNLKALGQFELKELKPGNYDFDTLELEAERLIANSGFLLTDPSFHVEFTNEFQEYFEEYRQEVLVFWLGSASLIFPLIALLVVFSGMGLSYFDSELLKELRKQRIYGQRFRNIFVMLIFEKLLQITTGVLIATIPANLYAWITNAGITPMTNAIALSGLLIYLIHFGYVITLTFQYFKISPLQTNVETIKTPNSRRLIAFLSMFIVFSFSLILLLEGIVQPTLTQKILFEKVKNLLLVLLVLLATISSGKLISSIRIGKVFSKRKRILNQQKHTWTFFSFILLTLLILSSTVALILIIGTSNEILVDINLPADMIVDNLNENDFGSLNRMLSSDFSSIEWTFVTEANVRTSSISNLWLIGIMENFTNAIHFPHYIHQNAIFDIPKLTWDKSSTIPALVNEEVAEFSVVNSSLPLRGVNTTDLFNVDVDSFGTFDLFPMIDYNRNNKSTANYPIFAITDISFVQMIVDSYSASLYSTKSMILMKGPLTILTEIEEKLISMGHSDITYRQYVADRYIPTFSQFILQLLKQILILSSLIFAITVVLFNMFPIHEEIALLRYFRLIKIAHREIISNKTLFSVAIGIVSFVFVLPFSVMLVALISDIIGATVIYNNELIKQIALGETIIEVLFLVSMLGAALIYGQTYKRTRLINIGGD